MPDPSESTPALPVGPAATLAGGVNFPATQWSMVLRVQRNDAELAQALNDFCSRYWYPIYAFVRSRGFEKPDAEDITQGFFLKAVSGSLIQHAEPTRGRLRSFLLGALNRHLADHLRFEKAEKRGGRAIVLPMDCYTAEERYQTETTDYRDPELLFHMAWAHALLDRIKSQVREHYAKSGRERLFDALAPSITLQDDAADYSELSTQFGISESQLRLLVFRMRKRFGKLLREAIAETVETDEEMKEEMNWLLQVLRTS